ncbi:MAG: hypothetical protein IJX87_01645 [Clostridia bacterium]|nr:hypothetical protein [Clostridia bacterium]
MKEELIISDIAAAVLEKDRLTSEVVVDKWRALAYETPKYSGTLVWAATQCKPQPLTLPLKAKGKYHVYLGMINMGGDTTTGLRLSNDEAVSHVRTQGYGYWLSSEYIVENYWKTVDLDGKTALIITKPDGCTAQQSALVWLRLVPVDEQAETQKTPCIAYHLDLDYWAEDEYPTVQAATGRIKTFADGGTKLILHEGYTLEENREKAEDISVDGSLYPRASKYPSYFQRKEEFHQALVEASHGMGSEIYLTFRIQAGGFVAPHDAGGILQIFREDWTDMQEFRCRTRDGRWMETCSFAYPEVRKKILDKIMSLMNVDFDGVSLLFHRGMFVAFEQPICDYVSEKYGVDARRLPASDPRYNEAASYFVTLFIRELRAQLDWRFSKRKGINVIVYHTPEASKNYGFDVETWINEGLIDGVSQGLMTVFEDLDGCYADDGLIDLEKYTAKMKQTPTVCRDYSADPDLIEKGAKAFMKLCDGKVDFYATLTWEHPDDATIIDLADRLKKIGATQFISWNANHKAKFLNRINTEKFYIAGTKEEYGAKKAQYYRLLSINGADVSQYSPNWKG